MYYDLTRGSISKSLFFFALPMMAGNLLQQFYKNPESVHPHLPAAICNEFWNTDGAGACQQLWSHDYGCFCGSGKD